VSQSGRLAVRLGQELRFTRRSTWQAVVRLATSHDLTFAASIAFYALLSLFPFLLLVVSALGTVTQEDQARAEVLALVAQYSPTRLDFVAEQLNALGQATFGTSLVGVIALLWASMGVFGAITSAVNAAWRVEEERGFFRHRLVSFVMLVAAGAVLAGGIGLVGVLTQLGPPATVSTWVAPVLAVLLLSLGLGLVFYFVPHTTIRLRDVWVGALLTGILWRVALSGMSWVLGFNLGLAALQGSIAAAVTFLIWMYVSAVILLFGVEFTASYARLREGSRDVFPG
jgi:membrane protein